MKTSEIATLKTWITESNRIVFFGGAGVSTESGIHSFTPFIVFGRKKTVTAKRQLRSYWSCCILVFTGLRTEPGHTCPQAFTSALHLLRPDTALTWNTDLL